MKKQPIDIYYKHLSPELFNVSPVHKTIFIHIPKSAGTSIRYALFHSSIVRHISAEETNLKLWEKLETFSIIRHPSTRLISHYKYHCKSGYNGILMKKFPDLKSYSIEEYMEKCVIGSKNLMFQPQFRFLVNSRSVSKPFVDTILRFEEMEKIKKFLRKRFGIELPTLKTTANISIPPLQKSLKLKIEDFYAVDFEQFGY